MSAGHETSEVRERFFNMDGERTRDTGREACGSTVSIWLGAGHDAVQSFASSASSDSAR